MRIVLFFLLIGQIATGQNTLPGKDSAKVSLIEGLPSAQPFDTARRWQRVTDSLMYIVSEKDLYDHFGYNTYMKFRDFDFAGRHIMGELRCMQCMKVCHHEEGGTNCHRNRCMYEWAWWIRDSKKAFRKINIIVRPRYDSKTGGGQRWLRDTLVQDADTANWMTTGMGDCHATFRYTLFEDMYTHSLILFEHNYYGGCRAGGSKPFTILFRMPEGIKDYYKHTILEEMENKE